ncbi:ABC transporter ATP-binding protein [Kineococcus arenarius]|uniref:ABC transporter ATP-binding protein n=1 Tax=unclassified Kineococcus TaxID=2621656 RepID=UPI003D7C5BE3
MSAATPVTGPTPPAVAVSGLSVDHVGRSGRHRVLHDVDLHLAQGRSLAVVGESGAGKSTLAAAFGRLQPRSAQRVAGSVRTAGHDVDALDPRALRRLRRDVLGVIAQDPVGALDPTMRIGRQLARCLRLHGRPADTGEQVRLLEQVRIDAPERVVRLFPHEVSGGMAQRVVIALALVGTPRLLVADEPTASLDAGVREEVVRLLFDRATATGASVVWLSHDLRAVRRWCDEIAVMRAGRVVEHGPTREVFAAPRHPYTRALLACDPALAAPGQRLRTVDDLLAGA